MVMLVDLVIFDHFIVNILILIRQCFGTVIFDSIYARLICKHARFPGRGNAEWNVHMTSVVVVCDESEHTIYPFLYLEQVTLLTLAQARLSPCSGFAHP